MGKINDVLIVANSNYVPIYFIVLDIDCNPSCPIILGRPFLRTIGASVSTIPKTLCDLLDFRNFDDCSLNLHLADSTIKKPMGRINDVLIFDAYSQNKAFTEHIVDALMQSYEETLEL